MTSPQKPSARQPDEPAGARRRIQISTLVALFVALTLAVMTVRLGHRWLTTRARLARLEAEASSLAARNVVLQRAEDTLRSSEFQICNKSSDPLVLPWIAAVHHDGQRLQLFDSSRCSGWRIPELASGEQRALHFSSTQEGCNWGGQVLFYAFNAVRDARDGWTSYNVIGPWGRDFDPKCFSVR